MAEIRELDPMEAAAAFDVITRREMGIAGVEFLRRWDAGVYEGRRLDDVPGLVDVFMAMGLVR